METLLCQAPKNEDELKNLIWVQNKDDPKKGDPKKWDDPKYKYNPKNKDLPKNEHDPENEDDLKSKMYLNWQKTLLIKLPSRN